MLQSAGGSFSPPPCIPPIAGLQCAGQPLQYRVIWAKLSIAVRSRNPELALLQHGLQTSNIHITWEFVKNVESLGLPQIYYKVESIV